jgi:hypothetical protein
MRKCLSIAYTRNGFQFRRRQFRGKVTQQFTESKQKTNKGKIRRLKYYFNNTNLEFSTIPTSAETLQYQLKTSWAVIVRSIICVLLQTPIVIIIIIIIITIIITIALLLALIARDEK